MYGIPYSTWGDANDTNYYYSVSGMEKIPNIAYMKVAAVSCRGCDEIKNLQCTGPTKDTDISGDFIGISIKLGIACGANEEWSNKYEGNCSSPYTIYLAVCLKLIC